MLFSVSHRKNVHTPSKECYVSLRFQRALTSILSDVVAVVVVVIVGDVATKLGNCVYVAAYIYNHVFKVAMLPI